MNRTSAIIGLLGLTLGTAFGQSSYQERYGHSSGSLVQGGVDAPAQPVVFTAKDPLREIDGIIYKVPAPDAALGWMEFSGRVWNVQPHGICLTGNFDGYAGDFFVTNFPYDAADNDLFGRDVANSKCWCAKYAGTHTYRTVAGSTKTLRMLDYGQVYTPAPPTPEQVAAAKQAVLDKEAAADKRALDSNLDAAEKGDAYGLLRMGERYRDGEGVEKDLVKAKAYLQRAAAAGSPTAADELKKFPEISH